MYYSHRRKIEGNLPMNNWKLETQWLTCNTVLTEVQTKLVWALVTLATCKPKQTVFWFLWLIKESLNGKIGEKKDHCMWLNKKWSLWNHHRPPSSTPPQNKIGLFLAQSYIRILHLISSIIMNANLDVQDWTNSSLDQDNHQLSMVKMYVVENYFSLFVNNKIQWLK